MSIAHEKPLTARSVAALTKPGRYYGGVPGLWLVVTKNGTRNWVFRYTARLSGAEREMGLGSYDQLSPKDACRRVLELWPMVLAGRDPVAERKAERAKRPLIRIKSMSLLECGLECIRHLSPGWKTAHEAREWELSFKRDIPAETGAIAVADVDTTVALHILQPLWQRIPESASRLRGRLERVIDYAKARGLRTGDENPFRWRGHLDALLPNLKRNRQQRHHPSLPYDEVPAFAADLRARAGVPARAIEILLLTAKRTNEVIGARWPEIDFGRRVWTIPAARMKVGGDHEVPLCDRAIEILRGLPRDADCDFVFPSSVAGKRIGHGAMARVMNELRPGFPPHGLRASFRTWCQEQTTFPREIAEAALGHVIGGKVERAYARSDMLEKRRRLLQAWSRFVVSPTRMQVPVIRLVGAE